MRIRTFAKWTGIVLGCLLLAAGAVVGWFYWSIGQDLDRKYVFDVAAVPVPTSPKDLEEGARLARLRGCNGGCHGDGTGGAIWMEFPDGSKLVAPDLGARAQVYSDLDFVRLLRHGIRPNGTSVIAIMPSNMFYHLTDEDLGRIIAFVRSRQPTEPLPDSHWGPIGRAMLYYYRTVYEDIVVADSYDHAAASPDPYSDDPVEHGRYLALTACTECHGDDLHGSPPDEIPPLTVVAAYSEEQFRHLMQTGEPIGGRELGLMSEVAVGRFSHFTDAEVGDLYAFLSTLIAAAD